MPENPRGRGAALQTPVLHKGDVYVVEVPGWAAPSGLRIPTCPKSSSSAWGGYTARTTGSPWPGLGSAEGHRAVAGGSFCPPGVLLDPHPEHSHPEEPAAVADQAGCAEPLPANHYTAQDPHRQSPGGHQGPAGHGQHNALLGQWGWGHTGPFTSLDSCDIRLPSPQVLLCMQGLADICATGTHPQHHRAVRLLLCQE